MLERKTTNGTDGRKTASSKPPTEVDPKNLEVDPLKSFEVDPKKKERERGVSAAPAVASASENQKPSLPLSSPPAGSNLPQDEAARDKKRRQTIDNIIERVKFISGGKAGFGKKARADIVDALRDLGGPVTKGELDDAIRAKLKLCKDEVSYQNFGSILAADFVATVRFQRARAAVEETENGCRLIHQTLRSCVRRCRCGFN